MERKEYIKEWKQKNKEKVKDYNTQWKLDNKELRREQRKRYRQKNADKIREYKKLQKSLPKNRLDHAIGREITKHLRLNNIDKANKIGRAHV